ncbi:MAG: potassium channel protein [Candidatus Eisenbacteria bacterium]|nr:potassium channel protein [Candidatus Latescibacterota bacterium]MBD3302728.1 potassium channel protein [Candidatus Eisenbacteria bacterium]
MLNTLVAQIASVLRSRRGRRNIRVLLRFFIVLAVMISVYTVTFHLLMLREGQNHTWITGLYWTLTVMSTLGFGDITFHTDAGRLFSIVVLLSGMTFLLVLLPITFIEFFYEPWMHAQAAARAPVRLPGTTRGHVLLTHHDTVTSALIRRLEPYQHPYVLLVPEVEEALQLHDLGLNVVVGNLDDPETWGRVRVEAAVLVVSTSSDVTNTNVAFTVRGLVKDLPIITSATDEASVDLLKLAGSNFVLRLEEMIGGSFARRTVGGDAMAHLIGRFDDLLIAEATARRTPLVGKTLLENRLRENVGATVVGVWERGRFEPARPETLIRDNTVLVLAGSREQLYRYDELFCIYNVSAAPVVILGGGRVGRATARALARQEMDYRIVEVLPELIQDPERDVLGNAADLAVLEKAGIREAPAVIITPHDDDLNVYLTIYCRQLRPDIQILCRATHERNVATLHRAGADSVLSYASMGASTVMNLLRRGKTLMVAEGLDLFEVRVPAELAGLAITESGIRERTGCSVVAIRTDRGMEVGPDPSATLVAEADMVLVGTLEAQERFLEHFRRNQTADA